MFYAGWNYDVRMKLVRMYGRDSEVHVRKEVPPSEYVDRMLSAKFCPVCGGFSQWTPRLAEAIYYECVPVILSPHMLPPWSEILDWSTFAVRLDPTAATLKGLKAHLASLDHASLFRNVRAAKHALTYQLDGYTGADLLPLLPCETHKRAAVTSWAVRELSNSVEAARDYDAGVPNVPSQKAHAVNATGHACQQAWRCSTSDGYMCSCSKERARTAGVRPGTGGGAAPESAFAAGSSPVPTPHPAGPLAEEAWSETGHGHELHHST
ncbi:hypothetical protein EMIHUDRAFT_227792 [Emiliania huxleyi CCMP1516]|uniref:Exostosin GT47 domain-containing protein n=2 Tax=Emiliania huxleyi TaxID=2903 RepID=A0A0D3KH12_EMIH1|nr:hypothetical protein EMIHUDRAFT_227792 [Emiliania huxleyi CCMP1516]EOD35047.1 hypothetical protein EMIHUDRAFT_227792 [Emiliania huxleyi CCMP1516]|eukprot:XP_005787476.1 hypothetical protein EMIHUDRAFT_227792 [Emiliania huxleyi CCMP1516]